MPAIESGGRAPYAPTKGIVDVFDHVRRRDLPSRFTNEVLQRIGITENIAPRTLQTLRLLDLIEDDGTPTQLLHLLHRAPEESFKAQLADAVRGTYSEVFTFVNPAEDDPIKIRDAFRVYKPYAMHDRMARLFVGLCAYVGMIPEAPSIPKLGTSNVEAGGRPRRRKSLTEGSATARVWAGPMRDRQRQADTTEPSTESHPAPPPATRVHPFVRGLIETLPPAGTEWSDEKREEWLTAARATFNLMYLRPADDSQPHLKLSPSSAEGKND